MTSSRRFPAPWSVHEIADAFVIDDALGRRIATVPFRREPETARQAGVPTYEEARRIAANIAWMSELIGS